jgi:hypothetical protein
MNAELLLAALDWAFINNATRGAGWCGLIAAVILLLAYLWFKNKADKE